MLFAFARGRLSSKSTMHEGMAIVSQNAFVNQIALNPNFTLIKSLGRKEANTNYLKNIDTSESYQNGLLKVKLDTPNIWEQKPPFIKFKIRNR